MNGELVQEKLQGLGGWLMLVGLGLFLSPMMISATMYETYKPIFSENVWAILTTPGNEAYHPFWSTFLVGEITVNLCLIFAFCWLIILFFSKKKQFPTTFIVIMIIHPVSILVDSALLTIILPNEPIFDSETTKALTRSSPSAVVWILYMLRSKRVKATFIT
jgi:ABC-type spermidine/putrescine transport system permease subunit I